MDLVKLLRSFSIRTRMLSAIAIVLTLLLLIAGGGLYGMWTIREASETHVLKSSVLSQRLSSLSVAASRMSHLDDRIVDARQRLEITTGSIAEWEAVHKDSLRLLAELDQLVSPEQLALVQQLAKQLRQHENEFAPKVAELKAESPNADAGLSAARDLGKSSLKETEATFQQLGLLFDDDAKKANAEYRAKVRLTLIAFCSFALIAAVVVVPTTLANMASICRPMEAAGRLADAIAHGDLTQEIDTDGSDEVAGLLRGLNDMQTSLQRLVGGIRQASESIHTASIEIASGNQDLSDRTEQMASALQQTASAMGQLTLGVRQTADSSGTANRLAQTASQAALRGGTVVARVVDNMTDITESSRKVAEILSVIDGIAFQTNILALNAAVEAAQAGEQGRGFAVVAGEVRNLAQRSASAANEIKGLIGASVERIEEGSRLVQDAGTTMQEIVTGVQQVNDIVSEITTAAEQQSGELMQVNTSVDQLDEVTQQNAALVEQSAAAAASLREQAGRLAEVVGVFRLNPTSA
jgi:methyl-accepting chemotaxis protein